MFISVQSIYSYTVLNIQNANSNSIRVSWKYLHSFYILLIHNSIHFTHGKKFNKIRSTSSLTVKYVRQIVSGHGAESRRCNLALFRLILKFCFSFFYFSLPIDASPINKKAKTSKCLQWENIAWWSSFTETYTAKRYVGCRMCHLFEFSRIYITNLGVFPKQKIQN